MNCRNVSNNLICVIVTILVYWGETWLHKVFAPLCHIGMGLEITIKDYVIAIARN